MAERASQGQTLPGERVALSHPFYSLFVKRALDIVFALLALPPLLLVMLPVAVAVRLTSPGPVLYRAPRGGYHNKPFDILKFRTMVVGADKGSGTTALHDPRVTRVGGFLRKTKLDELPQIFNILRGEMSFIGPRPELLKYTERYTPEQQCIFWVRPGLSDESSIAFINLDEAVGPVNPESSYERNVLPIKNEMRVRYAKSQSFLTDARLFLRTVSSVAKKAARVVRGRA